MSLVSTIAPAALGLLVAGGSYLYSRHLQASARTLRASRAQATVAAAETDEPIFPEMRQAVAEGQDRRTKTEGRAEVVSKVWDYIKRNNLQGANIGDNPTPVDTPPAPQPGVRAKP